MGRIFGPNDSFAESSEWPNQPGVTFTYAKERTVFSLCGACPDSSPSRPSDCGPAAIDDEFLLHRWMKDNCWSIYLTQLVYIRTGSQYSSCPPIVARVQPDYPGPVVAGKPSATRGGKRRPSFRFPPISSRSLLARPWRKCLAFDSLSVLMPRSDP